MQKQTVKSHDSELLPNIVYDSFSEELWEMEGFFETLSGYFEGSPEQVAEDLIDVVHDMLSIEMNRMFMLPLQKSLLVLLNLRKAFQGMKQINE